LLSSPSSPFTAEFSVIIREGELKKKDYKLLCWSNIADSSEVGNEMSAMAQRNRLIDLGDGISLEVIRERENLLIGRKEIEGLVYHGGKGTPSLPALREKLAKSFGVNLNQLYIRSLKTEYGISRSKILFNIYKTPRVANEYEPKYVIERNKTLQEEIEEAEKKEKKG
jgi:small subunit ribosomal protein S24e